VSQRVLIVGAGQAAAQTAISLRQAKFDGEIVMLGAERWLPYQRPPLSKQMLQGEWDAERCLLRKPEFYDQHEIRIEEGRVATGVEIDARTVATADGESFAYDWLVIATGSELIRLALPGSDLDGVCYLRSLNDALRLAPRLSAGERVTVVGGGYIGLEVAASARKADCEVVVVEALDGLMKRSALPEVAAWLQRRHEAEGVDIRLGSGVAAFEGDGSLEAVVLTDGTRVACDTAVVGVGVRPAVGWLESSGIDCARGVLSDERCRTSVENVYAAGDCSEHRHATLPGRRVLESVQNAIGQGRIVAAQITGQDKVYDEVPWFWSEQYDCRLQMAGLPGEGDRTVLRGPAAEGSFSAFTLADGRVTGVQAINAPKDFMAGKMMIARNTVVDAEALANSENELKELM
jgi:3-phenylpropionate/trans-cinnamate dioxygenase ferredoxin reductase subunit